MTASRVDIPATGLHILPAMTRPGVLLAKDGKHIVVELTPIRDGRPSDALCRLPLPRQSALELLALLLDLAQQQGWELPSGGIVKSRLQ